MSLFGNKEFDDRRHYALLEYRRLRDDFLDFLEYVPLEKAHFSVHSPKLSSLIRDECEQIMDSLEIWILAPLSSFYMRINVEQKRIEGFNVKRKSFIEDIMKKKEERNSMSYGELRGFIKEHEDIYYVFENLEDATVWVVPLEESIFKHPHKMSAY